jgi:uncharacterized protein YdaU (DUF1376 family)
MNFVKLYIGDYMRDTGTLTVAEHGAYVLMLLHHYGTEKPLPTGRELHRLLRAESKADRDAIDSVVHRFWQGTPDGLVNKRAGREMGRAEHQREVNRIVGAKGGRPKRTETESLTESLTETEPNHNPNQTPDTRHQTPEKKYPGGIPPEPPARAKRAREAPPESLPPWVDPEAWGGFVAMRQAMRKPMTPAARRLAVAELAKLRDAGHDPTDVLRQSTFRSWAGLFPLRGDDVGDGGSRHAGSNGLGPHGNATLRSAQALERRLFADPREEQNHEP